MCTEGPTISLEEVDRALAEIENRFNLPSPKHNTDSLNGTLLVLSKEFDSLGIPTIDVSQPLKSVFRQVVESARTLVQIHRRAISNIKEVNITSKCKDFKNHELYKKIDDYEKNLLKMKEQNSQLHNKLVLLNIEYEDSLKKADDLKSELDKTKRFYMSKQKEMNNRMKKLFLENQKLNEALGKDIGTYHSQDSINLNVVKELKMKEEVYKKTIQTLQKNNKELVEEVLNLKEQILCPSMEKELD